jgi:hypothetical protein
MPERYVVIGINQVERKLVAIGNREGEAFTSEKYANDLRREMAQQITKYNQWVTIRIEPMPQEVP